MRPRHPADRAFRRALLGLLVLTAGLLVRQGRAEDRPDFARWEKEVAAFEQQDKDSPPPEHAVLFVGSSSIRRWDLAKSFPDLGVINRGFGGSQLADAVHFAPRLVLKHEPRLVVLYAGDNDIAAGKTPEQVAGDFEAFVRVVHDKLPKTRIAFLSIKPSIQRWQLVDKMRKANALIEARCKQDERLLYIDVATLLLGDDGKPRPELFAKDGLHLNDKGYALWASVLTPHLK
jgi:lysophospholipase L1-like esterase